MEFDVTRYIYEIISQIFQEDYLITHFQNDTMHSYSHQNATQNLKGVDLWKREKKAADGSDADHAGAVGEASVRAEAGVGCDTTRPTPLLSPRRWPRQPGAASS